MDDRLLRAALVAILVLAGCGGGPDPAAPDLSRLSLGMGYPTLAIMAGGPCEHIHDRGIRVLEWHYEDGSLVEATIHNGGLSGLDFADGDAPRGRSTAAVRVKAGVQADMPVEELRERLGQHAITTEDISDRECRWTFADGTLTAVFMRGGLEQATWRDVENGDPVTLVTVTDPIAMLLDDLRSERESDRYRALRALDGVDDTRMSDALVDLLRIETDRMNRGMAATLLAQRGDPRASDLLLQDLEYKRIREEIVEALAQVGDARAEAALARAAERVDNPGMKSRIEQARRRIDKRIGRDWPADSYR